MPVVAVAIATPLTASSGRGWVISEIDAAYRLDAGAGGYRLDVRFTLARADGGAFPAYSARIILDSASEFSGRAPYPSGTVARPSYTWGPPVSLDATSFRVEVGPQGAMGRTLLIARNWASNDCWEGRSFRCVASMGRDCQIEVCHLVRFRL